MASVGNTAIETIRSTIPDAGSRVRGCGSSLTSRSFRSPLAEPARDCAVGCGDHYRCRTGAGILRTFRLGSHAQSRPSARPAQGRGGGNYALAERVNGTPGESIAGPDRTALLAG